MWARNVTNISEEVQPLGFAAPIDPVGAPGSMIGLKLTRGNTSIGVTKVPSALTAAMTVTRGSRSAEVVCPTCLAPLLAKTLGGM